MVRLFIDINVLGFYSIVKFIGIEFVRFKVRDIDSDSVLFEINKPAGSNSNPFLNFILNLEGDAPNDENSTDTGPDEEESDSENHDGDKSFTPRFIRYYFKPSFLRLR
jgi:hypothetical protein